MLANIFSALGILVEIVNIYILVHTGQWCEPLLVVTPVPWVLAYAFANAAASRADEAARLTARIARRD
jgi:hypothetical protein